VWNSPDMETLLQERIDEIVAGEGTPYSAAEELLTQAGLSGP